MIGSIVKVMRVMGYPYVVLFTKEDETAKFFYKKIGYRRIGAFLPPEQDADEIMFLKELKWFSWVYNDYTRVGG